MPAAAALGMSGAREQDAGLASGLYNTTAQLGSALGAAGLTTLAAARTNSLLASGHPHAQALLGGYHLAFAVGAGLLIAAMVVTALLLRPEQTAAPLTVADACEGEPAPAARTRDPV
jgi:hypothetical protein